MKIQLGSGDRYEEGWVNVDLFADRADVREDLRTVNFEPLCAEHVRCVHTIEHFSRADAVDILKRVRKWLKSGGTLEIETPDRKRCMNLMFYECAHLLGGKGLLGGRSHDKPGWHAWITAWAQTPDLEAYIKSQNVGAVEIPPQWELPGERHHYVWSGEELAQMLKDLGFRDVKGSKPKHHGGKAWRDCRVTGVKA